MQKYYTKQEAEVFRKQLVIENSLALEARKIYSKGINPRVTDIKEINMKIIDIVKDKKVVFSRYRQGNLYYKTECGIEFPVPISDLGEATLLAEDKAMLFMRYIRKHLAQTT